MSNSQSSSNPGSQGPQSSLSTQLQASLETMAALVRSAEEGLTRALSSGNEQASQRERTRAILESIASSIEQTLGAVQTLAREQGGFGESFAALQTGSESSSVALRELTASIEAVRNDTSAVAELASALSQTITQTARSVKGVSGNAEDLAAAGEQLLSS